MGRSGGGKAFPSDKGKGKCKGPEVGLRLACLRQSKGASVSMQSGE